QGFLTGEFSTTRVQGPQFNTLLVRAGMPGLVWANFEHWTRALRDVESTGDDRTHVQAKFEPVGPISEGEHFQGFLTGEFSTTRVQGPQFNTLLVRAGMPGLVWA
ncbi:hypothetical protein CTI14_58700, partial [Methylobacterium radiotolerans]